MYYKLGVIGYSIGLSKIIILLIFLALCVVCLFVFGLAQPALLYLTPSTLLTITIYAVYKK